MDAPVNTSRGNGAAPVAAPAARADRAVADDAGHVHPQLAGVIADAYGRDPDVTAHGPWDDTPLGDAA